MEGKRMNVSLRVSNNWVPFSSGHRLVDERSRPLILAADQGYAMPLATALRSIVKSNPADWPLNFHVLCEGFSEVLRAKVAGSLPEGSATISWIEVDLGGFDGIWRASHLSKMTFARLLIPQLFPESVSRVLYLDADLLMFGTLESLWEMDLGSAVVGAVIDSGIDHILKQNGRGCENVPRVRNYFNAGVLLMELRRWREENISEKVLNYLSQNPRSPFSDQDALNVACDGLWHSMDGGWNQQVQPSARGAHWYSDSNPSILHFVTNAKPWDASVSHPDAALYDRFRAATCFSRTRYDLVLDMLKGMWGGGRRAMAQSALLRTIWRWIKPNLRRLTSR